MITVSWLGGLTCSDVDCEKLYALLVRRERDGKDTNVSYVCENVYNRIRLGIVEGELDCANVRFEFEGEYIYPNRFGAVANWTDGWCDYNVSIAEKIIKGAMLKRKTEREEKSNGNVRL
jgi:hypothetical protein